MGEAFKQQAAERALAFVEPGMKLGLGTGSTAAAFVARLGAKVHAGLDVSAWRRRRRRGRRPGRWGSR